MASTAKAGRGTKAKPPKGGQAAKPAKKQAKKKGKRKGAMTAEGQGNFLATVKQANPGLTAEGFAEIAKIPLEEQTRMRAFVIEYIKDFDETAAASRMGYPEPSTPGKLLLIHSYSQILIDEELAKRSIDDLVPDEWIVARLKREATRPDVFGCSNSASRIAALKELAKIKRLTAPPTQTPTGLSLGGVMVVPLAVDTAAWGKVAHGSQGELKSAVVDI